MEYNNKMADCPKLSYETIKRMEDMTWFTSAQIFDDLLIVAQKETACYIWKTEKGLVVFDGIWPDKAVYDAIMKAIEDAGWAKNPITKFVITHGHVDHTGCGKWLKENQVAKTYLSKVDDDFWREHPTKPERPETWKDFDIDFHVTEGDRIDCGDKEILVVSTPGHTPGCLSYLFPVYDKGEKHMAGLFGGATPPWNNPQGTKEHLDSIHHFVDVARQNKADVALCNHTIFDNGLERIAYSNARLSYMPNVYVVGTYGFEEFCKVYERVAE